MAEKSQIPNPSSVSSALCVASLEEKSMRLAEAIRKATPMLVELSNAIDEWNIALLKWKKEIH